MGRDNQPKDRRRVKLERKQGNKASYDRILIVSEGKKTEPIYFEELRIHLRLQTAKIKMVPSDYGTDPLSVVNYAYDLFNEGSAQHHISPKSFERVYAVFDRDEHKTYFEALNRADTINDNMRLKNDLKKQVQFKAIVTIPSFELWLLLHYKDIHPEYEVHRDKIFSKLKKYMPKYEKGLREIFQNTWFLHCDALDRADILRKHNNPHTGKLPYTDIDELIRLLKSFSPY